MSETAQPIQYPANIKDIEDSNPKLNILLYGEPGTGKTRFIGTASKKMKTLIGSAEKGLLSIRKLMKETGDDKLKPEDRQIKQWEIGSYEDLEALVQYFLFTKHDFGCLALDSGTEIQQRCMESILRKESRTKAQQADWGTLGDKMSYLTRQLRDSPYSFIMTALSDTKVDQNTGEQKVAPEFQGRFQALSTGFFDEVFYAYSESKKKDDGSIDIKYKLLTRNSGKFQGKDRSGELPIVVEPDFSVIYDTIFKKETK